MSHRKRYGPAFQSLESRLPMAGNVTVVIEGNDVIITGDDAANAIFLGPGQVSGSTMDGEPTSINGTPNGFFNFGNLTGNHFVRMHGGGDFVRTVAEKPKGLVIDLGTGNDKLECDSFRTGTELIVDGNDGDDAIILMVNDPRTRNTVGTSATVRGGAGGDLIEWTNLDAMNEVAVHGGAGSDLMRARGGEVRNILFVNGEADSDRIEMESTRTRVLALHGEGGFNAFRIDHCTTHGGAAVHSGNEADFVEVIVSSAPDYFAFLTGGGSDHLVLNDARTGWLGVITGAGSDFVDIPANVVEHFYAEMGEDHDTLKIRNLTLRQSALLDGGPGGDVLDVSMSTFGFRELRNWEVVTGI
jgi:hypothetical protein